MRDGQQTNTIPTNMAQCGGSDCDADQTYGMHESYQWYVDCTWRAGNAQLVRASCRFCEHSTR